MTLSLSNTGAGSQLHTNFNTMKKAILNRVSENLFAEMKIIYKTKQPQFGFAGVSTPLEVREYLRSIWDDDVIEFQEEFIVLYLNRAQKIIGWQKVSQGGMAGTVCDPKIVFAGALLAGASALICCHNHPSGNLKPSQSDHEILKKLSVSGKMLDIQVLDNLIITKDGFLSFADDGLMPCY